MYCYQLQLSNYEHGLTLETGIYISKISPGSLAAKEGNLAVGDRVLSVSINSTICVWVRLRSLKNSNLLRENSQPERITPIFTTSVNEFQSNLADWPRFGKFIKIQ